MSIFTVPLEQILQSDTNLRPGSFYADKIRPSYAAHTLGQVAKIVTSPGSTDELIQRGLPYVDISSIDVEAGLLKDLHTLDSSAPPARARHVAQSGDLLVSMVRPGRGAVAVVPSSLKQLIVSNAVAVVRPHPSVPVTALWAWLRSVQMQNWFGAVAPQVVMPRISLGDVHLIPVPKTIPSSIKALDKGIRDLINELATIEPKSPQQDPFSTGLGIRIPEPQSSLFFVTRHKLDGRRLDPGSYSPRYEQLEKTLANCSYPLRPLAEVGELLVGTPTSRSDKSGQQHLVLGPANVTMEGLCLSEARTSALGRQPVGVIPNDVILVLAGSPGTAAVAPPTAENMVINNSLALVRLKPDACCTPSYLAAYLNSDLGKELVQYRLVGTTFARLNLQTLYDLPVVCPPKQLQEKLVRRLSRTETQLAIDRLSDLETQLLEALEPRA